jgi:heparosan-N-sulfate-glucuronate 5-epimerase
MGRLNYYRRVASAYLTSRQSHLTFWHEIPSVNESSRIDVLGPYYMTFRSKADYNVHLDGMGVPMLDYQGSVGLQYNPIAIAQYGLGNFNLLSETGDELRRHRFLIAADWLVEHLEKNDHGVPVWNHHFDWEYRTVLKDPWYSALSQGQGLSLLVRAHKVTGDDRYVDTADRAFEAFMRDMDQGGVRYCDTTGHTWLEETIVSPPTHILNGFIWASWGVYDYWLYMGMEAALDLFFEAKRTLIDRLHEFDTGWWSLYEQAGKPMRMLASPFYHSLHIEQLKVMHRLTGESLFREYATRWERYRHRPITRRYAMAHKALFKLLYY